MQWFPREGKNGSRERKTHQRMDIGGENEMRKPSSKDGKILYETKYLHWWKPPFAYISDNLRYLVSPHRDGASLISSGRGWNQTTWQGKKKKNYCMIWHRRDYMTGRVRRWFRSHSQRKFLDAFHCWWLVTPNPSICYPQNTQVINTSLEWVRLCLGLTYLLLIINQSAANSSI